MIKKTFTGVCIALSIFSLIINAAEEVSPPSVSIPSSTHSSKPDTETEAQVTAILEDKLNQKSLEKSIIPSTPLVILNYKDTPIVNIINELASKMGVNILLPQGAQVITTKITINNDKKLTLPQAWAKITSFLELLGYTWIPHNEYLGLKKVDPNITRREGLPLFIDVPVKDIPNTPDFIQAIFYLSNIKINDPDGPITAILNDPQTGMLSKDAFVQIDEKTNAIIIVDRANAIRSTMTIVKELDLEGIPDAIEVMPLYYTEASFVEALFTKDLLTVPDQQQQPITQPARKGAQQSTYFPPNTKVKALDRTNSVVIMGSKKAIHIIHDFIVKYIDHPLESGRSILHVYDLQYLDAQQFQTVLQGLVNPSQTGQSEGQAAPGGPRRDFQDVIIIAEPTSTTAPVAPTSTGDSTTTAAPTQGVQQGGNRLIIAARDHDWKRIKHLISELDVPQAQVVLEVLVVDLVVQRTKNLGSQLRNPLGLSDSLDPSLNFQSAQLGNIILKPAESFSDPNSLSTQGSVIPANALMANLLQFFDGDSTNGNLASVSPVGSLIITLQDPDNSGTWNVWRILSQYTNASVMSQPFIVTTNNKQATITSQEQRLLGAGANSDGGAIKANTTWVPAPTTIDITPRISKIANTVNLQVAISVVEYVNNTQDNRISRQVQTNANVANGEVLAIGGLMRERDDIQDLKVPLLGDIPLIGWFFKSKQKIRNKTNLMVFITPRIVIPMKGNKVSGFTQEKLCLAQQNIDAPISSTELRDPITRWFFKPNINNGERTVDMFVEDKIASFNETTNQTVIAQAKTTPLRPASTIPNTILAQEEKAISQPKNISAASVAVNTAPLNERAAKLTALVQNEENPVLKRQKATG